MPEPLAPREKELAQAIQPKPASMPLPARKPKAPTEQAKPRPAPPSPVAAPREIQIARASPADQADSDADTRVSTAATASAGGGRGAAVDPSLGTNADGSATASTQAAGLAPPVSAEAAADYAGLLGAWLDRRKRYPDRARRKRQEGMVLLEFALDGSGQVLRHRIIESSGYDLLDAEVEALIRRSSPLPPPPGGSGQTYVVPIVFALR